MCLALAERASKDPTELVSLDRRFDSEADAINAADGLDPR
jgi:hypothetical protein